MRIDARVSIEAAHRLRCTNDAFDVANPTLSELLDREDRDRARVSVFVDDGVLKAWPDLAGRIITYCDTHALELASPPTAVPGGEVSKNDRSILDDVMRALHEAKLCRRSYALIVGGGAVLDTVGYGAGIVHRGIRSVRVPSTSLAQCDSGVGVKCGVNRFGKKNYEGLFGVPWGVVNDESLLSSLAPTDWRGGFSEVVKIGLLKDPALFEATEAAASAVCDGSIEAGIPLIRRSAELHLRHIVDGGDPFETLEARPLDFGHWAAHKLEQMSDFRVGHGDAVAIGLRLDVLYAARIGMLPMALATRICDCLDALGLLGWDESLRSQDTLLDGLEEFREHLGGRLTVTLVRGVGDPVDVHEMDGSAVRAALDLLAERAAVTRGV